MLHDSVFRAGVSGIQQSQGRMYQIADEVSKLNTHSAHQRGAASVGAVPLAPAGAAVADLPAKQSVVQADHAAASGRSTSRDLSSVMVDQRREQLVFTASARVVEAANHTLGNLLDAWS